MSSLPGFAEQVALTTAALKRVENVSLTDTRAVIAPYRICPLGAHVDHQGGPVLGRTVAAGTALAFAPLSNPEMRLYSERFGEACFPLGQAPDLQHWARYAQAAALVLQSEHALKQGLVGVVHGSLIGTGLSSSASVGLAYLSALAHVNGIECTNEEFIRLERTLENEFLGLKIGILDPATIVHGQEGALLHIDTVSSTVTPVHDSHKAEEVVWLVAYSGVSRQLIQSGYNNRVTECVEAAALLQPGAKRLGEIPQQIYLERQGQLPEHLQRRAAHFFSEVERVHNGIKAWGESDLERFGALMNASCASSIHQYESGSPALIDLQSIVSAAPGLYGSRFSGGGYGGCVVGLARREKTAEALEFITTRYAKQHPDLAEHAAVYLMETDGGLRFAEAG